MIMIDLESLDVGTAPIIAQVSAVRFDLEGDVLDTFNRYVSIDSCVAKGMTVSGETLRFWLNQDRELQKSVFESGDEKSIEDVLTDFSGWVGASCGETVWVNGAIADALWLESAFHRSGIPSPIQHFQYRDMKSLINTVQETMPNIGHPPYSVTGTPHNAVNDCTNQVKRLVAYLEALHKCDSHAC